MLIYKMYFFQVIQELWVRHNLIDVNQKQVLTNAFALPLLPEDRIHEGCLNICKNVKKPKLIYQSFTQDLSNVIVDLHSVILLPEANTLRYNTAMQMYSWIMFLNQKLPVNYLVKLIINYNFLKIL